MADIESSCTFKMSDNDTEEITACGIAGDALSKEIDKCIKPSNTTDQSCTCLIGLSTDNLDKVKSCNISENNKAAQKAKMKCTKSMRAEQAEAETVILLFVVVQVSASARRPRTPRWT